MTEELKEILINELEEIENMPYSAIPEHIYFNIILSENFEDVEDELLDELKEWYSDYEFYINSGEAEEHELEELIDEAVNLIRQYVAEE